MIKYLLSLLLPVSLLAQQTPSRFTDFDKSVLYEIAQASKAERDSAVIRFRQIVDFYMKINGAFMQDASFRKLKSTAQGLIDCVNVTLVNPEKVAEMAQKFELLQQRLNNIMEGVDDDKSALRLKVEYEDQRDRLKRAYDEASKSYSGKERREAMKILKQKTDSLKIDYQNNLKALQAVPQTID